LKKFLPILTAAVVLSAVAANAESVVSDMEIKSTPSEWGTNVFGEWSFWSVAEYYNTDMPVETLPDVSQRKYINIDEVGTYGDAGMISPAGDYTHKGVVKLGDVNRIFDDLYGHGIVMSCKTEWHNDSMDWTSDMITYPYAKDGMVRFRAGNTAGNDKDVAVMFTVPEDGSYNIYLDVVNKGQTGSNGYRGFGNSDFGRLSVITSGETSETSQNSTDFAIPNANADVGAEFDSVSELTAGTRIFLRIHNGHQWDFDDFYAKFIITKYDKNGNAEKVYDLNRAGYSSLGNVQFLRAKSGETDASKYMPMFAAKPQNVTSVPAFADGYAAPVAANVKWANSKVSMNGTPNVGWNKADGVLTVTSGTEDFLMSWTAPESGKYKIYTTAAYKANTMARNEVWVSVLKKGQTEDADVKNTIKLLPGQTSGKSDGFAVDLEAGDKIIYRVVKGSADYTITLKPDIEKVEKDFYVDVENNLSECLGTTVDIEANIVNLTNSQKEIQIFACQYSQDGKLLKMTKAKPLNTGAWETGIATLPVELSEEASGGTLEFYAWSDFETAEVLTDYIIINL